MFFKKTLIGIASAILGFIITWLISQNLVLAAISGAFLAYFYVGYLITSGKNELRMENFCNFSIRFSMAILFISILETLLRRAGVHSGPISLAFSWPLIIIGGILFLLSLVRELSILLNKWRAFIMEIEEGMG